VSPDGFAPLDELQVDPRRATVYEHGWQSWSPSGVHPADGTSERPRLGWQHVMRFRPGAALPANGFQGEGLLVVVPGDGEPVRTFAAADATVDVPSIRARLEGDRLVVAADGPVQVIMSPAGPGGLGRALEKYGDAERDRTDGRPLRPAPTAWCSWYHYFLDVTQDDIVENADAVARLDLPVDVVQVDDGWQAGIGDWQDLSPRFTSMSDLAARIRDTGRRAGIWLAPFMAGDGSALAGDHPDWLVGEAGTNWGQQLAGLDLTHPQVRDHLWTVLRGLRDVGYDYFKLDFLYAGALPGPRHRDVTAAQAYREGLHLVRDAVGEDSYVVGCGAPLLPSVGLVDAMRVAPDTYNPLVAEVPQNAGSPLRGRAGVEARAWQQGRLWVNDGDSLVARPAFGLRREWAEVVERYSGLRSFSDRIADLDDWGLETVRRLLTTVPPPTPFAQLPDPYVR
jgi:alpha-galactosidase